MLIIDFYDIIIIGEFMKQAKKKNILNEVKKKPLLFRIIKKCVAIFYRKYKVESTSNILPPGNIYVSNHAQVHGPIGQYLYFPQKRYIWVTGEMCNRKEVTNYAMEDFWRDKSKWKKWLYKLFSIIIVAPLGSYLFSRADTIPVYKDGRLRTTMMKTIKALDDDNDVIIFPESRTPYNNYLFEFQKNFVDVARPYTKKTGKDLHFYPMYICSDLKKILIGDPIKFNPNNDIENEREIITQYLKDEITKLGDSLPNHTIVPYVNVHRKYYKKSKE
jgi:hypothetical protein